jgi:hypothetical protein
MSGAPNLVEYFWDYDLTNDADRLTPLQNRARYFRRSGQSAAERETVGALAEIKLQNG